METITLTLNKRELAAILAGLDLYWCHAYDGFNEAGTRDLASNNGEFDPLSHEDTELLSTRLCGFVPERKAE